MPARDGAAFEVERFSVLLRIKFSSLPSALLRCESCAVRARGGESGKDATRTNEARAYNKCRKKPRRRFAALSAGKLNQGSLASALVGRDGWQRGTSTTAELNPLLYCNSVTEGAW